MPEKVRVSPAGRPPLSTGAGADQAALLLLELLDEPDEPDEDDDPLDDEPFEDDDPESEDDEDDEEVDVAESLLAGTVLVPVERLSFR